MTTMFIPETEPFRNLRFWLKEIVRTRKFGLIRLNDGDDLIVILPEQLAELDAILSDPAFAAAVEEGAADVANSRVKRLKRGDTLRDLPRLQTLPCDESLSSAVEQGVRDVVAGKTKRLRKGQSLRDLG